MPDEEKSPTAPSLVPKADLVPTDYFGKIIRLLIVIVAAALIYFKGDNAQIMLLGGMLIGHASSYFFGGE